MPGCTNTNDVMSITERYQDDSKDDTNNNDNDNKLNEIIAVSDTNDIKTNMLNDISIVSDDNYDDDNKENNGNKRQRLVGNWSNMKILKTDDDKDLSSIQFSDGDVYETLINGSPNNASNDVTISQIDLNSQNSFPDCDFNDDCSSFYNNTDDFFIQIDEHFYDNSNDFYNNSNDFYDNINDFYDNSNEFRDACKSILDDASDEENE